MHADALSKGTNSKQIPRVEEHVNKNISKLCMFYFLRIYFIRTRVLHNQYMQSQRTGSQDTFNFGRSVWLIGYL